MKIKPIAFIAAIVGVVAIGGTSYFFEHSKVITTSSDTPSALPRVDVEILVKEFKDILTAYRKIIVLFSDEKLLSAKERKEAERIGHALFHENQTHLSKVDEALGEMTSINNTSRFDELNVLLNYVESDKDLFDADRLAFRELLHSLLIYVARDSSLPAVKMHKRISEDLDALAEIEHNYEKEIRQIFGRFEQRSIELKRERWDSYIAYLKKLYTR